MSRHTILKTKEGKNIGIQEVWTPDNEEPAIFPSILTDRIQKTDLPAVADRARPFFRWSAAGKQQFCVRFSSGAVQIIATEP